MRVTNLADNFDGASDVQLFNLHDYAKNLYQQVNGKDPQEPKIVIKEVSLSANQDVDEYKKGQQGILLMQGEDDDKIQKLA